MENWEFTQATIALLEWSWNVENIIWNPFFAPEWFINAVLHSNIWLWASLLLFFLWLIALIRVIKDSNARSSSFAFQLLSALLVIAFTPILWLLIYIAIRPQWRKWDKTKRRDIAFQNIQICENCWNFNKSDNLFCTSCWEILKVSCRECQNKYSSSYAYCPECGAPNLSE